ncbi:MAG: glycyl-radical enzyme activating protein [Planctomycetota bacterium]|nr:glycyl-radical enzyme activating protein [Planctomycetota bacterium]
MGMILDIKKFAIHDGPGIRTTVFFKGCPLDCWWCHNPESRETGPEPVFRGGRCIRCGRCVDACDAGAITMTDDGPAVDDDRCRLALACVEACPTEARQVIGREMTIEDVMREIARDVVFYDESGGGATMSGGEPLIQPDFLGRLLRACRDDGIHTTLDTTGHAPPEVVDAVADDVDLFLYDLKLMDDARHRKYCGAPNELILENLRRLSGEGREIIVRIPLVPGITDDATNLEAIGSFVASLPAQHPIDILPYQRLGIDKYDMMKRPCPLRDLQAPGEESVEAAVHLLARSGGGRVMVRGETT